MKVVLASALVASASAGFFQKNLPVGSTCNLFKQCATGLSCLPDWTGAGKKCADNTPVAALCKSDWECFDGFCNVQGKCTDYRLNGQACAVTLKCKPGFDCKNNRCQMSTDAPVEVGSATVTVDSVLSASELESARQAFCVNVADFYDLELTSFTCTAVQTATRRRLLAGATYEFRALTESVDAVVLAINSNVNLGATAARNSIANFAKDAVTGSSSATVTAVVGKATVTTEYVASPVASPITSPVAASPVASPVAASPVASPVAASPVASPVAASPVASPVAASPVASPVAASPTPQPVDSPTPQPVDSPTPQPVDSPTPASSASASDYTGCIACTDGGFTWTNFQNAGCLDSSTSSPCTEQLLTGGGCVTASTGCCKACTFLRQKWYADADTCTSATTLDGASPTTC